MRKIIAGLMCVLIPILLLGTCTFASDRVPEVAAEFSKVGMTAKNPNQIISSPEAPELQSNPTGGKGLGDLGKPPDYDQTIKRFRQIIPDLDTYVDTVLPDSWTGQYTTAKDQGSCGSCWAFATAGTMESKILIAGGPTYDLSEQEQISCNHCNYGCCGGYSTALKFWYAQGPMQESCADYGESGWSTSCDPIPSPPYTVTCGSLNSCSRLGYYTTGYYTVDTSSTNEIKTSLYNDGPTYFRFDVYGDFNDYPTGFWYSASPGDVYTHSSGAYKGGHAVLIIGWDDNKSAWLCKNSWGATGGPQGDGTFWIAWSGYSALDFGMANVQLATTSNIQSLWYQPNDQPGNGVVSTYYTDFSNGVYSADDFTNTVRWAINTIFTEGFVKKDSTLYSLTTAASSLSWYIYPDSSGVPAGYPGDGNNNHVWSYTCPPTDSEVAVNSGTATLDLTDTGYTGSPINLQPGTYWLCFYPSIDYSTYGAWYWYVSCSENPQPAHLIDPGNLYVSGYTTWTSWQTVTGDYDAAFRLDGTARGGFNPGIGLLLLGD
ncbi:MAG: hypothetical protein JRI94_13260 [Deltaproteobacteria bacterium]|nr:hypothetical protein [Deltaproteobacteria bacterium]